VDFGGLRELKGWLEDMFDHKLVLDKNDPHMETFKDLQKKKLCEIRVLDGVGAEKFAYHAWQRADNMIREFTNNRCWCESVECMEHGANSAIYQR
jgi:6-pyruvoyltetrahydropterin/6-carboxytetrahydropterin synthase